MASDDSLIEDLALRAQFDALQTALEGSTSSADAEPDWRETAVRLQADMDNFRKRQRRLAEEAASGERERLLAAILPVADNLEKALAIEDMASMKAWKGVALVHRELMRMLRAEGVCRVEALGQAFDPARHEAVAKRTAPAPSGTVVEELQAGYTLGTRLLRPARVVVAT